MALPLPCGKDARIGADSRANLPYGPKVLVELLQVPGASLRPRATAIRIL